MYPDDYKRDFKTISEEHIGDCIYAHLQGKKYVLECECCGSDQIKSKGVRTKKAFRDITAGNKSVYLTLEIPRYFCKDCDAKLKAAGAKSGELKENGKPVQSTYSVDCLPDCVPDDGKISASIVDEIISLIATKHLTVNEAAEKMQVAPSSVSAALKKRRIIADKSITNFREPDNLLVYPFNYVKTERCALIGMLGNRPMLYGLLVDCKEETIKNFLDDKDTRDNKTWRLNAVLTDFPRPDEHKMLDARYKDAHLGILRECVLDRVAKLRKKNYSRKVLAIIDDALAELSVVLETHIYFREEGIFLPFDSLYPEVQDEIYNKSWFDTEAQNSFETMFDEWWDALPETAQSSLKQFHRDVKTEVEKIVAGFTYIKLQHNPSDLLRFIGVCRKRKIPFADLPGWLALVAGVHNRENISAVQMLSSSFVPQPMNDFYIDLYELNDLFDKEFRS